MLRKIARIVYLFALAGLIGLASERRTGLSETDIVPQIFFCWGIRIRPRGALPSEAGFAARWSTAAPSK